MRRLIFAVLLLLPQTSRACLQDRDTLAQEARGLPDVVQTVTGRFPRNPPRFYEMRIQRTRAALKRNPTNDALYDDIAVANDRIGRDDEALIWIEKKRAILPPLRDAAPPVREAWYRYFANAGTFRAHKWLREGGNRKRIGEMKRAANEIRRAIHIKPSAHFGRETYQLKVMQWIIWPPKTKEDVPDVLGLRWSGRMDEKSAQAAEKAFCGLIVLGNAWESVDVFYALKVVLTKSGNASLTYLTNFRIRELIDSGRGSLYPGAPRGAALKKIVAPQHEDMEGYPTANSPEELEKIFKRLRLEANGYQARRTSYMMARLEAGKHPDTDAHFWDDWHDDGPPSLGAPSLSHIILWQQGVGFILIGIVLLPPILWWALKRRQRGRVRIAA